MLYPFVYSLILSLYSHKGLTSTWQGLGNYKRLLKDAVFLKSLGNNILFLVDLSVMDDMRAHMRLAYQLSYHASAPGKLVLTQYTAQPSAEKFERKLKNLGGSEDETSAQAG